jgi:hypothetical protein
MSSCDGRDATHVVEVPMRHENSERSERSGAKLAEDTIGLVTRIDDDRILRAGAMEQIAVRRDGTDRKAYDGEVRVGDLRAPSRREGRGLHGTAACDGRPAAARV